MSKFLDYLKSNVWFLLGLVILVWVIFVNIFPEGYVFGGGDTVQLLAAKTTFFKNFFEWEGRIFWFYFIFYLLDNLNVSESAQLSWYLGIFIFGSYISFYIFSRLIFKNISQRLAVFVSLFYALNLYTFFVFTGNWGYSYFPSLYIFIPLLVGVLLKFIQEKNFFWIAVFCLVLFLSSSGFGNLAFALSFGLFSLSLMIFLYLFKYFKIDKILIGNLILLVVLSFSVSAHWLFPSALEVKTGVSEITANKHVIEFDYIIKKNSNPIFNTLSLINISDNYFPNKFPNETLEKFKSVFFVLAFLPIFLVFVGIFRSKKLKKSEKRLFWSLLGLLGVFAVLVAKVRPPFEIINHYIYHIWGFSTLRGFDKTAIYIPFLLAALVLIVLKNIGNKKLVGILAFLILIIPLPYYTGKIQQNIGYRLSENKNYQDASLSFLVKIPEEYYNTRNIINSDSDKNFITTLPISKNDGSGIVSYPRWKYYGGDITKDLYDKKFIEANLKYFDDWSFASEFDQQTGGDFSWIIKLLGMMNSKYILYHKDVDEEYVENSQWKMDLMERDGLIKKIEDNDYFNLYEINKDYILPYLTWQKNKIPIEGNLESINENFEVVKDNSSSADFREVNPKKFVIDVEDISAGGNLIMAEKFDPLWRAYSVDKSGKKKEIKTHFMARGYANGWTIAPSSPKELLGKELEGVTPATSDELDPNNLQGKLEGVKGARIIIEYYPISLMWRGIWISSISVLFLIGYLLKYYYDKKRIA